MNRHEYNNVIDELSAQLYRYAFHFMRNEEDAKANYTDGHEKVSETQSIDFKRIEEQK